MICPSCGNRFLQPFVCTICLYNVRDAEAARPQPEVLEKENAALRETIRAMQSEYICACGIRVTPHKCPADNGF